MVAVDPLSLVAQVGSIALWLKAIGGVVVLWIIFQGVGFYFNLKRFKKMEVIMGDMNQKESVPSVTTTKHFLLAGTMFVYVT